MQDKKWSWSNFETFIKCCWDSNDENNFLHKFLLINTQISKFLKAFTNGFSANMKLLKTQLHKIEQSGGFLGGILKGHF